MPREDLMEENKNSKLKWFLGHFEEVSCAVLFSVMTLIASANIVTRYLFRYSFAFTEELVVSLFVWLTLFGASIAFRTGSHLGFTLLFQKMPIRLRQIQIWFFCALSAILFVTLIYYSIKQVHYEMTFNIRSMGVGIPQWYYTIGMPVWSALVLFRIFHGSYRASQKLGLGGE
jgi:TRAP-type C4-dicarboxylate transport system permease small subunit